MSCSMMFVVSWLLNKLQKAENHEEWRKLVVKFYSGAPTVSQTKG